MCVSPIKIRNPYYSPNMDYFFRVDTIRGQKVRHKVFKSEFDKLTKNFDDEFLFVGCGKCYECLVERQSNYILRSELESNSSHVFFATLTYSDAELPTVVTSNGEVLPYADHKHLQDAFKRIRKDNAFSRPFKYIAVSEYGGKRHRPHMHVIIFLKRKDTDTIYDALKFERQLFGVLLSEWRVNRGSNFSPDWHPLCNYVRFVSLGVMSSNYDLHLVRSRSGSYGISEVYHYLTKYLFKSSCYVHDLRKRLLDEAIVNFGDCLSRKMFTRDYDYHQALLRMHLNLSARLFFPHCFKSVHLGEDKAFIREAIHRFANEDVQTVNPSISLLVGNVGKAFKFPRSWTDKYLRPDLRVKRAYLLKLKRSQCVSAKNLELDAQRLFRASREVDIIDYLKDVVLID